LLADWAPNSQPESPTNPADRLAELQRVQRRGTAVLLNLVKALRGAADLGSAKLRVVTRGVHAVAPDDRAEGFAASTIWGLGKAVALEYPELRIALVDLDEARGEAEADALSRELLAGGSEDQVAFRRNERFVARLERLAFQLGRARGDQRRLVNRSSGLLDGLEFKPVQRTPPKAGEVEIEVCATGLNFRDVLLALGMYPGNNLVYGSECSGRVAALGDGVTRFAVGDPVFGLVQAGFSSYTATDARLVTRLPDGMSFEEAAGVPTAFVTAYYALTTLARLQRGDRVLIHAAAGGVGQAAVQIALSAGAEIFATAGTLQKREFLRRQGVAHVLDSRTLDFASKIAELTGGEGVDVVLNSLAGEFMTRSIDVLKSNGRFLELGVRDVWDQPRLQEVKPNATFSLVDLGRVASSEPRLAQELLESIVAKLASGELHPIARTDFRIDQISDAFRFMQHARHIGKIVVSSDAPRELLVRDDAEYLVTGGLGALGLHVARKLVERGARRLTLLGRNKPTPAAADAVRQLEELGAIVTIESADVADAIALEGIIARIAARGQVLRGIVHAAGIIDDGVLDQLDWQRFERVFAPKVAGSWNLHRLTQHLGLDFFVLFSSVSGLLGSPGQANYSAANAFLDGLAQHRRRHGQVATSIDWGAWAEQGLAAKTAILQRAAARGLRAFSPADGVRAFERLLESSRPQVAVLPVDWSSFFRMERPEWRESFFAQVTHSEAAGPIATSQPSGPPVIESILAAPSQRKRHQLLTDHVRTLVAKMLGLDAGAALRDSEPLRDVGFDSLMAVELRNHLRSTLKLTKALPATLAFDYPSIVDIAGFLSTVIPNFNLANSGDRPVASYPVETAIPGRSSEMAALAIEDLSDEEVDRRLAARLGKEVDHEAS
jgi:myxalamid-type polyketide synthase MxaB